MRINDAIDEFVYLVDWGVIDVNGYSFLSIKLKDKSLKFQIEVFEEDMIIANKFSESGTNIVKMSLIEDNAILKSTRLWRFEKDIDYSGKSNFEIEITDSLNDWLGLKDDSFRSDLDTKSNIYDEGEGVYIDWGSRSILGNYDSIISFEILDGKRIELFTVLETGKINKMYSKVYYGFDSPNNAPPSTHR
ncbi:hypothetical protein CEQ90_20435 [Lewinellaceae bacterium SD302]|nr:hypothetical protein CEQ90_20435 [Lewinellaceae bacterium SD302]